MTIQDNYHSIINHNAAIGIVGLGYVGLPLVVAFSQYIKVIGFDIDHEKVAALKAGKDPNMEVDMSELRTDHVEFTDDLSLLSTCPIYIVTVPTPITKNKTPDLRPLKSASEMIGQLLQPGDLVIYESTVYPGCTEEYCVPILSSQSGLRMPEDFKVGYSPERINPGDKVHTLTNTIKIVSGIDEVTAEVVANLYSLIIEAGVHRAATIKIAEAAKIVENVQRDVNIALVNELALIFDRMDIDTHQVIDAAGTKWNFHKYYPGLVGGHCIGVDPYYLTYKSQELGYYPQVILSGRKVNNDISTVVAKKVLHLLADQDVNLSEARVLILGVTFKENVRDIRNSRVIDVIHELQSYQMNLDIIDPHVDEDYLLKSTAIELTDTPSGRYHCIIAAVKHKVFEDLSEQYFEDILHQGAHIIDIKGMYKNVFERIPIWTL